MWAAAARHKSSGSHSEYASPKWRRENTESKKTKTETEYNTEENPQENHKEKYQDWSYRAEVLKKSIVSIECLTVSTYWETFTFGRQLGKTDEVVTGTQKTKKANKWDHIISSRRSKKFYKKYNYSTKPWQEVNVFIVTKHTY